MIRNEISLFVNASFIWIANMLPGIFGAVFWWLAARFYLPSEIGNASAVISSGALLASLSRFGLDISLIRFLPESEEKDKLLNTVFSFLLVTSTLFAGVFLVLVPIISPKLSVLTEELYNILGFLLLCVFITLMGTLSAVYIGQRAAKYSLWASLITNLSRLLLLIVLAKFFGASSIVAAVLCGIVFTVLVGFQSYLPALINNYKLRFYFAWRRVVPILPYSIGNFLADFVLQAPQTILPLMILNILGEISNGHAYIALMIGSMLTGPGLALGRSAFAEGSNRLNEISSILNQAAFTGSLVTLPLAGMTILLAPWILKFFGPSYTIEASGLLQWMAAASPIAVIVQIIYTRLRLKKEVMLLVGLSILNVVIILTVSMILLSKLGVIAAGIGVFFGNSLVGIFFLIYHSQSQRKQKAI